MVCVNTNTVRVYFLGIRWSHAATCPICSIRSRQCTRNAPPARTGRVFCTCSYTMWLCPDRCPRYAYNQNSAPSPVHGMLNCCVSHDPKYPPPLAFMHPESSTSYDYPSGRVSVFTFPISHIFLSLQPYLVPPHSSAPPPNNIAGIHVCSQRPPPESDAIGKPRLSLLGLGHHQAALCLLLLCPRSVRSSGDHPGANFFYGSLPRARAV